MSNTPYEIIAAPFEVYLTTGGDAFPAPTATPSGGWTLLGTNGKRNQMEGGVTIEHSQKLNPIRTEGHTGPVKVVRTEEDLKIRFTLLDLSKNVYKHAFNAEEATQVTTTQFYVPLSHAESIREVKLLVRGPSPAADGANCQYEVPRAVQSGNPAPVFSKSAPAGLEFEFMALDDMSASTTGQRFGRFTIGG